MRFSLRPVLFLCLGLIASISLQGEEQLYTCGMHPQIIEKEPGNCPICGMALVPIRSNVAVTASQEGRRIQYYKSSMIPGEVSSKPGKDSMGMDLLPVYEGGAEASDVIHIDSATIQRMNLKTGLVTRGSCASRTPDCRDHRF